MAKYSIVGTLGLEVAVVAAVIPLMIVMVINSKHYVARVFGYADPEAIWGLNLGGTDGSVVLYIDCVVTALHLLMPIRWVVLVPMEVVACLAYIVPALLLGSPTMNVVPHNVIGLLALTVMAAFGKRAFERQERGLFAGLLVEKQKRFQAEFELSERPRQVTSDEAAKAEGDRSVVPSSLPMTTTSAGAFDATLEHASLDQIRAIGQREQWLLASGEVELFTDVILGEGGFGIVVSGLYHNALVAVKAAKGGVTQGGLAELCNELRILRRIRHPNVAFFYGACMDVVTGKLCLVLELVDGLPLGGFIRGLSRGPGQPAEASAGEAEAGVQASGAATRAHLVFDILNVLRYLHSRQPVVVHGDLKDSNVCVEERCNRSGRNSYHAKLLDFGLSRIVTKNAKPLSGTLRWMAPELIAATAVSPDAAADCYSFGLLVYFIVAGRLPFQGTNKMQILSQLRRGQGPSLAWPTPAGELTKACGPVVEQCTQPKAASRPAVQQISDELSAVLGHVVGGDMETSVLETLRSRSSARGDTKTLPLGAGGPAGGGPVASPELQKFEGLVKLSQVSSSSVSALVPGICTQSVSVMPQKTAVLSAKGADGAAAARPDSPGSSHGQLAHPEFEPTPLTTQILTLTLLLYQWNVSSPDSPCCWLHSALHSLDRMRAELRCRPCSAKGPMLRGQCRSCGLLLLEGQAVCEFCECPGSCVAVDAAARSEDAFAV
ncbi:unnamed protein product [Prorocentrum cordatum]|uniref:Protein kinase domain-containing protein n=1 Tax=Prorocentrum cordatum TaxID=2364126 RepID=A0ABN9TE99_9DINO|nr:unnamed protein product [Polarella glacialis]